MTTLAPIWDTKIISQRYDSLVLKILSQERLVKNSGSCESTAGWFDSSVDSTDSIFGFCEFELMTL